MIPLNHIIAQKILEILTIKGSQESSMQTCEHAGAVITVREVFNSCELVVHHTEM